MRLAIVLGAALAALTFGVSAHAATLDDVKSAGVLKCGINTGLPGFAYTDDAGNWTGFDVAYCRAVAAAVLGDPDKVEYVNLTGKNRFPALASGEIDILSRNTTWTLTRDSALGLNFAGVIYYDGQGFMVRKTLGVGSARELDGATVCINAGTTTELNAADYFRTHRMRYTPVTFEKSDEVIAAYDAGRCDVYTTDQSGIYAQRIKLKNPGAHVVLPEIISKEPRGPVVRQGDDEWFNIVRWALFAMINAEELGVNSSNVARLAQTTSNPQIRRLLGAEHTGEGEIALIDAAAQIGDHGGHRVVVAA